jgi:putative ABC transport system permease protein
MMGGLLLGAALILPGLLCAGPAGRRRAGAPGPLVQWAWADTTPAARRACRWRSWRSCSRSRSMSASVPWSTASAAPSLGYLDQRLAAELYVAASDADQIAPLLAFLEPRTDAILPIWNVDTEVLGAPAELYASPTTRPIARTGRSSPPSPEPGT